MWDFKEPVAPFFSTIEKRQLAALLEAILPAGPNNPGATDAGAADYVAALLARDDSVYYELKDWKPIYTAGLAMLSAATAANYASRSLDQLTVQEVTELLANLAKGLLTGFPSADWQKKFFGILRAHCIEGCFADKRWGGNRANIMWQWYGYPTGPSVPFQRDAPNGGLPLNPGPAGLEAPSGNTFTAAKNPAEIQSSTIAPGLLKALISARETTTLRKEKGY